jgi:hypothetical protein
MVNQIDDGGRWFTIQGNQAKDLVVDERRTRSLCQFGNR